MSDPMRDHCPDDKCGHLALSHHTEGCAYCVCLNSPAFIRRYHNRQYPVQGGGFRCNHCNHGLGYHDQDGCHYQPAAAGRCDCCNRPPTTTRTRPEHPDTDLRALLEDLTDTNTCRYDHHGYCQAHGWLQDGECPHARAKKYLNQP